VKRVVAPTIPVVLTETSTYHQPQLRCNSDVASIEETMEVSPEQKSVANLMRPIVGVGTDVSSLESRKGMFARNGTGSTVRIENRDPKCGLAKTWLHQASVPITSMVLHRQRQSRVQGDVSKRRGMVEAGLPDASPLTYGEVILDGCLSTGLPVCRLRNPCATGKEDR
jgi:hypothetical protein